MRRAPIRSTLAWSLGLLFVALVGNPLHELGHWLGFAGAGIPAAISLDHTYYTKFWAPSFAGALGGPLMSVVSAWAGVLLFLRFERLRPIAAALAVFMPLTRLGAYFIFATHPQYPMIYNDEGVMGLDTGLGPWTWALILLPLLVLPVVVVSRRLDWPLSWRVVYILGAITAWYALAFKLEAEVLDPTLFPRAQTRELVMPHPPRGAPTSAVAPTQPSSGS